MGLIGKLSSSGHVKFAAFDAVRIPVSPGAYLIQYVENGRPKSFKRLNGIDCDGILSIGKSVNLRRRIGEFFRDVQLPDPKVHYHSEGWNWRAYFRDNSNPRALRLPFENMEAVWKVTRSKKSADELETKLIHEYLFAFQDKPPLNIQIKRKRNR